MSRVMAELLRDEVLRRAAELRVRYPQAPADFLAHSLAYETGLRADEIADILRAAFED